MIVLVPAAWSELVERATERLVRQDHPDSFLAIEFIRVIESWLPTIYQPV